ncbi:MAG: leucine-rich repeat protein, partial [Clostridia bacterium]|nr:leucine-rich repeat protein [Clostridia bacterium]
MADKKRWLAMMSLLLAFTLLIVTFSWYKNQVSLEGSTFSTGNLDFVATGYNETGTLTTTVLPKNADATKYQKVNEPLFNKNNWQAGITETAFLVIEKTGSLPMDFKIGFTAEGQVEYLGGFWYALTDITNDMAQYSGTDSARLQSYSNSGFAKQNEDNGYNMATMNRYATMGNVDDNVAKRYYRLDYGMKETAITEEYTNKAIEVFMHLYVTQPGAFEADASTGYTYNCSTVNDINNAIEKALPGDSIRLISNITYEGDLVINKAINLLTNNLSLEVLGNLIYNYVAPTGLTINTTGNGQIKVVSPSEGVGGNFTITTPNSEVRILGGNKAAGDISVDGIFTVQGTHAYGLAGISLSTVKVVNRASGTATTVYVNSDTRVTVTNNTTVSRIEAVAKASNIEIQNAGTIQNLVLTNMHITPQNNAPQIYVVNAGNITNAILLPNWSEPFVTQNTNPVSYSGNTRIVQTITGNNMTVSGATGFTNGDIEKESTDITVAPLGEGNGRLVVYYQNTPTQPNATIQSLLTEYFSKQGVETTSAISAVTELKIISVGDKDVTNADITYIAKSDAMPSLKSLDLERASVYDTGTRTADGLGYRAFYEVEKLTTLVLPQNLKQVGIESLAKMNANLLVTVPASVTTFEQNWYLGGKYVAFSSPTPVSSALQGMGDVQAVFVEETYIETYRTTYSSNAYFATRIYPMAQMDDTSTHFVRQLSGNTNWEIVCYVGAGNGEITVGSNVRVGGQPINIVGVGAYSYCNTLVGENCVIRFADSVEYIGERAFTTTTVTQITSWGTHMKTIHPWAFSYASRLTDVAAMPASMENIDSRAFYECTSLKAINTGGTTQLGVYVFYKCSAMTSAHLPHVMTIGNDTETASTFQNCTSLVSVSVPELTTVYGSQIFNNCTSLREIYAGSVADSATFGSTPFGSGTPAYKKLIKMYVPEEMVDLYKESSASARRATLDAKQVYAQGTKYGENLVNGYNIGEYIYSVNDDNSATLITSNLTYSGAAVLPDSFEGHNVSTIGRYAFVNQTFTSASLSFGNSVKTVEPYAFNALTGLTSVDLRNVSTLNGYCFYQATGLT